MRIIKDKTVVAVVDFQERLVPAMREGASAVSAAAKLIEGAKAIGCPILITQQYTKGLGDSVSEIKEAFSPFSHIEKSAFSAMGEPDFVKALADTGKKTVVLCGIEAHVCILQTALDLLAADYDVFLVVDAISSRKESDEKTGIERMIKSGVFPTTVESVLFELLENDSKSETFKTISRLVK
jgi:Amidases related to nicotinamidase